MMTISAKDLIKLRQIRKQKIKDLWCETQQEDIQKLIDLMENVASCAIMSCSGPMGSDLLKQAKQEFIDTLMEMEERYRCLEPECN